MCEFHDCNCNGLGDTWWTDKCTYFSSIDRFSVLTSAFCVLVVFQCGSLPVHAISCVSWEETAARAYHHALPFDSFNLLVNIIIYRYEHQCACFANLWQLSAL